MPEEVHGTTPKECVEIIMARVTGGQANSIEQYASRCEPNARLVAAFGISNSFTTTDKDLSNNFRSKAEKFVFIKRSDWPVLAKKAKAVVGRVFDNAQGSVPLVEALQMATMKMSLQVMFGIDADRTDVDTDIRWLASWVNEQWIRSKKFEPSDVSPAWHFNYQTDAQKRLRRIFPQLPTTLVGSDDNPFNYMLPGYETLWRIVLRCLVEVASDRHPSADRKLWQRLLQDFAKKPTLEQLDFKESNISACLIASEALRLYPPCRRIFRKFRTDSKDVMRVANIEECHRTSDKWGADPKIFQPSRWTNQPDPADTMKGVRELKDYFLAFGAEPFRCPAKRRAPNDPTNNKKDHLPFGVSMTALLVGLFTERMGQEWTLTGSDDLKPESAGVPLKVGRKDYAEVVFKRR